MLARCFWTTYLALVPILGVAVFAAAPWYDVWLPRDVSVDGPQVDSLFYLILWLTGIVFVVTQGLLALFTWQYTARKDAPPVEFVHGSDRAEFIWTLVPGLLLLFLAFYQMNVWADLTIRQPHNPDLIVEVTGRQFEWRIRYPGADGKFDTPDDLYTVNDLHVPIHKTVVVYLKSADVIHSFFLPNLRLKQDTVPGRKIAVWFNATEQGQFDLACAELCGWGHYKMKGRLTVQPEAEFQTWLAQLRDAQGATQ